MMNLFKADLFRIPREKVGVIPLGVLAVLIGLLTFFTRNYQEVSVLSLLSPISLVLVLTMISSGLYFWGNDFQYRTVNNLISKNVSRAKIFIYKVLASVLLATFYNVMAFLFLGLGRQVFSGANDWAVLVESFAQSFLFFLVLVAFIILLFNLLKGNALAITGFVVYILFFEQLIMSAVSFLLKTDRFNVLFWVQNYQLSLGEVKLEMWIVGVATLLLFLTLAYALFSRHELK